MSQLVGSIGLLFLLRPGCGQNQAISANPAAPDDSLGAVARRSVAKKESHAKVITDEDLQSHRGPLPSLKMNEAENGEDVLAAIAQYKQSHTPQETESVIRHWYDEYDRRLADLIQESQEIKTIRTANLNNAYELCENGNDYEACVKRRTEELHGARYDQEQIANNTQSIVRLQHSLMNIRNRLPQMGLRYDWFKIRTTNNIDRF